MRLVIPAGHNTLDAHIKSAIIKPSMNEYRKIKVTIPGWAAGLYILISVGLVPWTIYLGFRLPTEHLARNWDITWVGLDIAIIVALLATGILAKLGSIYMVIAAVVTGALFVTDAWFDILGYRVGSLGQAEALLMAVFGELPMAFMSFALAIHSLQRLHANNKTSA